MTDTIEQQITQLRNRATEYDKLSDSDKVSKIAEYNQIIIEKEQYSNMLTALKTELSIVPNTDNNSDISSCMANIEIIKTKMNADNITIIELIDLHKSLNGYIKFMDAYFNSKKLEIVQLP